MTLAALPFLFAPPHVARALAPATFQELAGASVAGALPVWEGESTRTIWGDPKSNHAFRAWHDSIHLAHALPFTLEGEREAARIQCHQLERRTLGKVARIVWREIAGQADYYAKHGAFPCDQLSFVLEGV